MSVSIYGPDFSDHLLVIFKTDEAALHPITSPLFMRLHVGVTGPFPLFEDG